MRHLAKRAALGFAVVGCTAVAFIAATAGPVAAALDGTSGQIQFLATAPSSVLLNGLASDDGMFAFDEQQHVRLAAPLSVDITTPGTYTQDSQLTPGTIAAGSVVNSQFVHSNELTKPCGDCARQFEGTVHTDSDILGVIVLSRTLDASDFLGAPGTAYPTGVLGRKLELNQHQADFLIEQVDRRTVVIHSDIRFQLVDQVRIITQGNRPPDCSAVSLSATSLWPPNHKLRLVTASGATDPDPGDSTTLVVDGVTQDEPVNDVGDGNTAPDAQLTSPLSASAWVRVERSGTGDGRVYRLHYTATDSHGATCSGTATVGVPHDQSGPAAVDSGAIFNSLAS